MADHSHTRHRTGVIARRGLAVITLSLMANAIVLFAVQTGGVAPAFRPLSWGSVLFLTTIGASGATVAYWILARLAEEPDRTFRTLAAVVLVLSFVPDLTLATNFPKATSAGIAVLMAMHVVVATISVGIFTRSAGGHERVTS